VGPGPGPGVDRHGTATMGSRSRPHGPARQPEPALRGRPGPIRLGPAEIALGAGWRPATDLFEEPERYVARLDLPGVLPADVTVEIEGTPSQFAASGGRIPESRARPTCAPSGRRAGSSWRWRSRPRSTETPSKPSTREGVLEIVLPRNTPSGRRASRSRSDDRGEGTMSDAQTKPPIAGSRSPTRRRWAATRLRSGGRVRRERRDATGGGARGRRLEALRARAEAAERKLYEFSAAFQRSATSRTRFAPASSATSIARPRSASAPSCRSPGRRRRPRPGSRSPKDIAAAAPLAQGVAIARIAS